MLLVMNTRNTATERTIRAQYPSPTTTDDEEGLLHHPNRRGKMTVRHLPADILSACLCDLDATLDAESHFYPDDAGICAIPLRSAR